MATTKLKIRNDLAKKSKGAPTAIYVQYCYDSKIKLFNTGKKIDPEFWDQENECVKRSYKGHTTINAVIESKKKDIERIVDEAQFKKLAPTLEYVEQQYNLLDNNQLPEANKDFLNLYEKYIKDRTPTSARNTIKVHRVAYNVLKEFEEKKKYKVTLDTINMTFYEKFTTFLIEDRKNNPNTVGNIINLLKVALNALTDQGINTNLEYKKKEFKTPSSPVDIVTLTAEELDTLYNWDLSGNKRLEKVRDLFVFCCCTGLRFSDIKNLKPENIKDEVIDFMTIKTLDRIYIPINPYSRGILAKYNNRLPNVPIIQRMNVFVKQLGEVCGINQPVEKVKFIGKKRVDLKVPKYELISTHTARRTFVTLSLEKGMRPEEVMKITGHKDISTMMRYVKITSNVVKSAMARAWGEAPKMQKVV